MLILTLIFVPFAGAQSLDSLWARSNSEFEAGDFAQAAKDYEMLLEAGQIKWEVYYNLGSAYFKSNDLGRAILNFERALRLDPSNEDVEHNLAVARALTVDRIEAVPQFFFIDWMTSLRDMLRPNTWTILLIIFVALTLGAVVLRRVKSARSWGLVIAVGVVALITFGFAQSSAHRVRGGMDAVVLNTASVVRSAPSASSKELFILHEGTVVELGESVEKYTEVRIESGSEGWILTSDIEKI